MPFWRCYYHVIWATKHRAPLISPPIEPIIYRTIQEKAHELDSQLLAINSVEDHIHVAACIPPRRSIAEWVKQVKGASTRVVNTQFPDLETTFGWQQSYGVLTFGSKNLDYVVDYVEHQKEHHAKQTLKPYLERIDND